jgi:ribose transport system substrate-binding protein
MAQNPYGQGYIAAYVLDLMASGACVVNADAPFIKTPQTARFIDSGTLLISADNVDGYKNDLKKITSDLLSSFKQKYLICK